MPERLDADTTFLHRVSGQSQPADPPGLAAFAPPRKTARGREHDLLFLCLSLRARAQQTVTPQRYAELLDLAAATFYGSSGSVTAALRQALATVNQNLLELNLKEGASAESGPRQGGLIGAVLRGNEFYAVQCGPGLLVVAHKTQTLQFSTLPSRPLGLSDALDAHYFHAEVHDGEYALLTPAAPTGWNDAIFGGLGGLATLTNVADRLKAAATADLAALVARFELGGVSAPLKAAPDAAPSSVKPTLSIPAVGLPKIDFSSLTGRLKIDLPPAEAKTPDVVPPSPVVAPPPEQPRPTGRPNPEPIAVSTVEPAPAPVTQSPDHPIVQSSTPSTPQSPNTDWSSLIQRAERFGNAEPLPSIPVVEEIPALQRPAPETPPKPRVSESARAGVQSVGRALGVTLTEFNRGWRTLVARMLPEDTGLKHDGLFTVPTSVQIGIAIVIPLVIVAIVALLYIQRGRAQQFDDTMIQAQVEVATARLSPNPLAARPHWERALEWLAQADQLSPGDEKVAQFRREAQTNLDALDGITRLDYQPLIVGGLGREVSVKQILLVGKEVYALDEKHNRILRLAPAANNAGYALDAAFECASGTFNDLTIGPLVDMALLPGPNVMGSDAIVALDTTGGLLYCALDLKPLATVLPVPESHWIRPAAIEVYADRLYVLDPGGNEVWQYLAVGGAFDQQPPAHYFSGVPFDLQNVVDFSIAGGDLFLLRNDGRVMGCSRAASGQPPACTDPLQFSDQREGRAPGDHLTDVTRPAYLSYDPPPEPSLYLIDADTAGLYQLSLKLAFVRQYRSRSPLGALVTSVAIDPAKQIFVGAGDNVYFAPRP
jgi:hypothetical protein